MKGTPTPSQNISWLTGVPSMGYYKSQWIGKYDSQQNNQPTSINYNSSIITYTPYACLKKGYNPYYSHLMGMMRINQAMWGYPISRHTHILEGNCFQQTHIFEVSIWFDSYIYIVILDNTSLDVFVILVDKCPYYAVFINFSNLSNTTSQPKVSHQPLALHDYRWGPEIKTAWWTCNEMNQAISH